MAPLISERPLYRQTLLTRLMFITDSTLCPRRLAETYAAAACAAHDNGVSVIIQIRHKELSAAEFTLYAESLISDISSRVSAPITYMVNEHLELLHLGVVAGVHRPAHPHDRLSCCAVRELFPSALIGASYHSQDAISPVVADAVDYLSFSPIFPSCSKPGYGPPLGPQRLAHFCKASPVPVFALGGVTPHTAPHLSQTGCFGVAVLGGLSQASDPASWVLELISSVSLLYSS